MDMVKTAG